MLENHTLLSHNVNLFIVLTLVFFLYKQHSKMRVLNLKVPMPDG